jgi:hypothetical protein
MNRSPLSLPSALLLSLLVGWGLQSGCAVEDTVVTIVTPDGSVGPLYDEQPDAGPEAAAAEDPDGGSPDAGSGL